MEFLSVAIGKINHVIEERGGRVIRVNDGLVVLQTTDGERCTVNHFGRVTRGGNTAGQDG